MKLSLKRSTLLAVSILFSSLPAVSAVSGITEPIVESILPTKTTIIGAESTLLKFPTGITPNFNKLEFEGYLTRSLPVPAKFKKSEDIVNEATFKVISNQSFKVFISADKFKAGPLPGDELAAERLQVSVMKEQTFVPYEDVPLKNDINSGFEIYSGGQTTIDGVTKKINFQLDLSENERFNDGIAFSTLLSNQNQNTVYSTNVTISLSTYP
jgi:hypothetical protein